MTKFNPKESSYQIMFISMLQIWNFRYSNHFWIIKYVGLQLIIFTIHLDATSFSKVFNIFDFMFLLILLLNIQ